MYSKAILSFCTLEGFKYSCWLALACICPKSKGFILILLLELPTNSLLEGNVLFCPPLNLSITFSMLANFFSKSEADSFFLSSVVLITFADSSSTVFSSSSFFNTIGVTASAVLFDLLHLY